MKASGAFRERLLGAWTELRENLGRSVLQALGVLLGVASVLGGFSISDSQRKRADEMFIKMGGLDKLNVMPRTAMKDGQPSALQQANLGLRDADALGGEALKADAIQGVSRQKGARARIVSAFADQDRSVSGIASAISGSPTTRSIYDASVRSVSVLPIERVIELRAGAGPRSRALSGAMAHLRARRPQTIAASHTRRRRVD